MAKMQLVGPEQAAAEEATAFHAQLIESFAVGRKMGWALAKIVFDARAKRIGGKPYWAWLGFDDEESYFGAPVNSGGLDYSMRSVRRLCEHWAEAQRLQIPERTLIELTPDKFEIAKSAIKAQPDKAEEWIEKIRTLPRSDLITEAREATGREDKGPPRRPVEAVVIEGLDLDDADAQEAGGRWYWETLLPGQRCLVHPDREAERAHAPISKGAKSDRHRVEFWCIPLCPECHREVIHQQGLEGIWWTYRSHVAAWFYRTIFALAARVAQAEKGAADAR